MILVFRFCMRLDSMVEMFYMLLISIDMIVVMSLMISVVLGLWIMRLLMMLLSS